jgi:hypothetical protein
MARRATAVVEVPAVKDTSDYLADALLALKGVDLRTIRDADQRNKVKTARTLLNEAHKSLK